MRFSFKLVHTPIRPCSIDWYYHFLCILSFSGATSTMFSSFFFHFLNDRPVLIPHSPSSLCVFCFSVRSFGDRMLILRGGACNTAPHFVFPHFAYCALLANPNILPHFVVPYLPHVCYSPIFPVAPFPLVRAIASRLSFLSH